MKITPFALERYFAKHEFSARYVLSSSDCEALTMSELLATADTEAIRLWNGLKLGYTETLGHSVLREAIAQIYAGIDNPDILVVVPEEGIFLLMHAILQPGDHIVCTFPGYQSLYEVARSIGCDVSTWEPDEECDWRFQVGQLEEMLRTNTKMVVVNFPHNPTGYVPTREDFERLSDLVRRRNLYLLSDEMYRFLEIDECPTLPSGCELYDRAFSLSGLSKVFGLPGLRIGWIVSQCREILERMTILKDYTTICNSAPSEILAIMALRSRDAIIGRQLKLLHKNIAVLDTFFKKYAALFRWNRPAGGSVCFPRLWSDQSADSLCLDLLQETGIMLVPSGAFQFGDHHIRIGFGRANLPEVIDRFEDYLGRRYR
jgi:aspartate/methionine/tyrosine aminotransferase